MKEFLLSLVLGFKVFKERNLEAISKVLVWVAVYWGFLFSVLAYNQRGYIAFGIEIIVPALLVLYAQYLGYKAKKAKSKNSIPVSRTRYTMKEGSRVYFREGKLKEAVIYLNEVESYLEMIGAYDEQEVEQETKRKLERGNASREEERSREVRTLRQSL